MENTRVEKVSFFDRMLNGIERVGNKLPDPVTIFLGLCVVIMILSAVVASNGVSVVHPGTGETIKVVNLMTVEQIQILLGSIVSNFQGFAPLGLVLVTMIGAGVCDKTGLMTSTIKASVSKIPKSRVTVVVMTIGMLANLASDAGTILFPPLAALVYLGVGRHPLIGLFSGYASVCLGFAANIMISVNDILAASFTVPAAQMLDANFEANATMNLIFMIASTFILIALATWVTEKIIAPRFGKYEGEVQIDVDGSLTDKEKKGLKSAGIAILIYIVIIVALSTIGERPFLADPETGDLLSKNAPLMSGMVPIIALAFFIPGVVYGKVTGKIKRDKDVVGLMADSMRDMGGYIILAFAASQFLQLFTNSNLGIILAVKGGEFLESAGIKGPLLLIGFILLSCFINLFIGSASAKWAILAPIFVPMFMIVGYNPALTQMAYRIGDCITNPLSPLFPYLPIILAFTKKYDEEAGIGTIIANMIPFSVAFLIVWTIFLIVFMIFNLPLGPGIYPSYSL
ncbi:AbgT family transporter [Romboutsia ilealis]|uniref:AbgT family transporter n=1 Tax=Romboutsia faecis TaxID=2764597 RepID=A0ABR7JQJ1_9FIRM|nr:AbgT family transporter [Romboutsia faecis]MBC5996876.1 AbgT family transporter [Romboutsia faecis]MRN24620.1 AbgT family transporter [Romboutsia ilealis]